MKIAIIGASGKTGRAFVDEAVQRGHEVRAGVFHTNSFTRSDYIDVIRCDALQLDDVINLTRGCDAVVSLIGHVKDSPEFLQTSATANILSAMGKHHIHRLVSVTGTGVRRPGDTPSLADLILNTGLRMADPARLRDGRAHADVLIDSDVDWTILRVLKLTNYGKERYRLTDHGPARTFVSRATIASAILDILIDDSHIRQMPVVS